MIQKIIYLLIITIIGSLFLPIKPLLAAGEVIRILQDNLQICTGASCTLAPPSDYGNVIVENKLGIGTGSPGYALHVAGSSGTNIRVEGSTNPRFSLNQTAGGADQKKWQNYAFTNGLNFTALNDAESVETAWLTVNRGTGTAISSIVFPSAAKVGIGTNTPMASLSIVTTNGEGIASKFRVYDDGGASTSDTSNSYGIGMRGSDGRLSYTAGTGGFQAFYTANTERMRIANGGNVGINTGGTAPAQPLDVNGYAIFGNSSYTYLYLRDDESTTGPKSIHANSNLIGFLNGAGNWMSYWNNAGNQTNTGTITAPTFSGALSGNATTATNLVSGASPTVGTLSFYGVGGDSGQAANNYYSIYQAPGAWTNPYPDLRIQYHTGIQMEAYYGYGGIRMYDGTALDVLAFAVGNGDATVKSYQTFYAAGANIGTTTTAGDQALNIFGNSHFYTTGGVSTGYVYSDGATFGLLNNVGSWAVKIANNGQEVIVPGNLRTYGAGGLNSINPANNAQSAQLHYSANVPRITVTGATLFQVRGPGESLWFSTYDTGDILIYGSSSNGGTFTHEYMACCSGAFRTDNWFRIKRGDGWTYRNLAVQAFWANGATRFDLAEVTPVDPNEELTLGEIVAVDDGDTLRVTKSSGKYDDKIVGIVSHGRTASMTIGGDTGPEKVNTTKDRKPIALVGRVVTMVNLESGVIKSGDPITSSSTAGIGMKATEAGTIISRAMENFDGSSVNSKEVTKMVDKLKEELKKEDPKTPPYTDIQDAISQLTKSLPKGTGRVISFVTVGKRGTTILKNQIDTLQKQVDELKSKLGN